MEVEIWGPWFIPFFDRPVRWEVYLALVAYFTGWAVLVLRRRPDFAALKGRRLALFLILLVLTVPLNNFLLLCVRSPELLPLPYLPAQPVPPTLPLLGFLPLAVAAAWMGVGPAAALGLLAGVLRAGTISHNLLEPFGLAFEAALIAYLLRQDYRGLLASVFRRPVIALPIAALVTWPLNLFSTYLFTYRPGGGVAALDYAWTFQQFVLALGLLEGLFHGLILQAVYLIGGRRAQPVAAAFRPPPYARSLSRRFLFSLLPLFLLLIVVLIYAVSRTAVSIATQQAVDALIRDASNGADRIASFIATGSSLSRQFATDRVIWEGEENLCLDRLRRDQQMLPYFTRLTAYDSSKNVLCTYPEGSGEETALAFDEEELFDVVWETGGTIATPVYQGVNGTIYMSFLSPLEDPRTGERHGVLVGRVNLLLNPPLSEALNGLQETMGQGEGFIVNAEGQIIAHPDPDHLFRSWAVDQSRPPIATWSDGRGWVREGRHSLTNARQLVCQVAVEGHPWSVVIVLPYEVILGLAVRIAGPLLGLLLLLSGLTSLVLLTITRQLTRPLNLLADAAGRIAAGDLEHPIRVQGEDEVACLGNALEKMRASLKARLDDLSLLLRVSQAVSASLDLTRGLPPILEGALQATGARVARIVLLSTAGQPQWAVGRGERTEGIGALDRALAWSVRNADGPIRVENPAQMRDLLPADAPAVGIQAAAAFPVRSQRRTVGVMWVGYTEPHRFDPSEVDLLATLAGQTAVLVENARLFQMAEGGRRRLSAILSSTRDAILVTDRQDRLLLINPAAEQVLDLKADEVVGKKVDEVPLEERLAHVLTAPIEEGGSLAVEVPLPNGRVYYASAATVLSAAGEAGGRVVVLRDITHFKKLDELKSEFVATVSHDLRAPLTFIRGYASMLPMAGELSEKQQEYVDKILNGIEQMSRLVEDLLNLGRIEAGVGLEKKPCHLGALIVEAVDGLRARATAKGITLRLESSEPAPVIRGDATLLRQAIANLVDNAIKYTPPGGLVTVGLRTTKQEALISVTDTGIGIAPEDQVRLFEKFYRVRRRETGGIEGTGLGLAIVKSVVERHGGRVWVKSAPHEGSTFTIALPLHPPEEK